MMYLSNDLNKLREHFNTALENGARIAYEKLEEGAEIFLQKALDPIANAMPNIPIETVVTKLMPAAVAGLGISFFSARHPEIFQVAATATAAVGAYPLSPFVRPAIRWPLKTHRQIMADRLKAKEF